MAALATAILGFVVLDGIWLGVIMSTFYRSQLAFIARMADGRLAPVWPVALLVYVLLGGGVVLFVLPRAASAGQAALYGGLLGLVVYGVYDLTNYSTLANWPAMITAVDLAWGTLACAAVAATTFALVPR